MAVLDRDQLRQPQIGLGLAALGRPAYLTVDHGSDVGDHPDPEVLEAHAHSVLDAAWQGGVRYFDAARSYGRAEEFLASWLTSREVGPTDAVVASKWGYTYTAAWQRDAEVHEVKDHSLQALERQWAETYATLGDHLDLYQIHSATLESGVLEDRRVLHRLAALRNAGVTVGLTTSGPGQAETIRRAVAVEAPGGGPLFATVQATWNLLETSAAPALAEAADAGLVVIVKEALANGRLAAHGDAADVVRRAHPDVSPDAVAIAAALDQPWTSVVLSGAASPHHIASNLRATGLIGSGVGDLGIAEEPAEYWAGRSRMPWT